jgi:hypothetical protein
MQTGPPAASKVKLDDLNIEGLDIFLDPRTNTQFVGIS